MTTLNFEIVRDAPRLKCKACSSAKIDIAPRGKEELYIICSECLVCEHITREEWAKLFV